MTLDEAMSTASGYAWGREDASGTRTASPTDAPGSLTFAEAFRTRQAAFNAGIARWMPAVTSAYDQWQAAAGRPDWAEPAGNLPGWVTTELAARGTSGP